jgi:hypothetical protein
VLESVAEIFRAYNSGFAHAGYRHAALACEQQLDGPLKLAVKPRHHVV